MGANSKIISAKILEIARQRGPSKTFCPSEVARALFPSNWRSKMEAVRISAFQLAGKGKVRILQGGAEVPEPEQVKGPIRIQIVL